MTREEAIKELEEDKALYMPEEWIESLDRDTPDGRLITALDMAIKALEQELCEDAISRAYIEPIVEELENICINGDEHILSLLSNIKNAPSVNPQEPCTNYCNSNQIEKA